MIRNTLEIADLSQGKAWINNDFKHFITTPWKVQKIRFLAFISFFYLNRFEKQKFLEIFDSERSNQHNLRAFEKEVLTHEG